MCRLLQRKRWVWSNIPMLTPIPIFGSIKSLRAMNMSLIKLERMYYNKYGRVYGQLQGRWLGLTLGDPELIKLVTVKESHIFLNRRTFPGTDEVSANTLFAARDDKWRKIRSAVTPAFTSGKMKKMVGVINDCAEALLQNLRDKARRKEDVDIKRNIGAFTMDVICSTAFGIRVDSHSDPNNPIVLEASKLFTNESIRFLLPIACKWLLRLVLETKSWFFGRRSLLTSIRFFEH
ncbi:CYP3A4 [Cordylochernes scorpioides]|uniref:CYP3A4 n=1 Tax=Cordylochernes scorpioides TaxID=51811 RepID=A0ABY6LNN3_9ARAC|nr:CYP3A4 [Cordylochernes scorpioides]